MSVTHDIRPRGKYATVDWTAAELEEKADVKNVVPASRKINNKALSADFSLSAADVGAPSVSETFKQSNVMSTHSTVLSWALSQATCSVTFSMAGTPLNAATDSPAPAEELFYILLKGIGPRLKVIALTYFHGRIWTRHAYDGVWGDAEWRQICPAVNALSMNERQMIVDKDLEIIELRRSLTDLDLTVRGGDSSGQSAN